VRPMKPDDVYRLAAAGDPRVSPDGRTIAFVVSTVDAETHEPRSAVWSVPADGSAEPRRLTFGGARDANPRWSPDGRWLAFTSGRGDDPAQLFVLPVDGPGESRRLTGLPEAVEQPAWSPNADRLVFQARAHDPGDDVEEASRRPPRRITRLQYRLDHEGWTEGREHHVYVVGLDGEPPTQLTDGPFDDQMPSWSPDGETIAFVSARDDDWDLQPTNRLYTISASGAAPEPIGSDVGAFLAPTWSADGSRIACVFVPGAFDDPRHGRIAVVDVASGALTRLSDDLDRNAAPFPMIRGPIWDGDRILFPAEDQGRVPVFSVSADGAPPVVELAADGYLTGFDLAGGTFAHSASSPTRFPEVFVGERRLSNVGAAFIDEVSLTEPEPFTAVSADGTEVPAWVLRPPGFDPDETYPAVLNIHGGPYTQYGDRFFDEFQMYAAAGYVVLYANPRGSSGYDESWGRAIRGPVEGGPGWGSVDHDDLMAVTDEALKRFTFIDADRLGVMGGSYGGYMTSWIVGHTDRFACAISERAVNDMASEDGSADIAGFFRGYVGADFWDDPEAYRRISPITYATQMTTPLLILHSEDDLRCPINQGEQLFTVLRSLRREVEFVRFPAESHELTRSGSPTHRVQRFEIVLEWLDRHLKR
jgi:dipeptidyl aminopeptidase/acylaminoacyl peptidase